MATLSESEHATVSVPVSEKLHYSLMGGFTAERDKTRRSGERKRRVRAIFCSFYSKLT